MENIKMLSAREAAQITGLSYATCLEMIKVHGKKIGRRYLISRSALEKVLLDDPCEEDEE